MKRGIFFNNSLIFLFILLGLSITACGRKGPVQGPQAPDGPRPKPERAVTIINRTGVQISNYSVNVASSGVEIHEGTPPNDSFSIVISRSYDADPEIEVVLVDRYTRIYAKTFNVPLEGNTDTPVTAEDRKSKGPLQDGWDDLVAKMNEIKN